MGRCHAVACVVLSLCCTCTAFKLNWEPVDAILESAIQNKYFPGCVAAVSTPDGIVYLKAFGRFTYGEPDPVSESSPPMTTSTVFDLASLTKVIGTTSAAALLYQRGYLHLDTTIASPELLGAGFAAQDKGMITVRNLLLHNSGYPPDPSPNYWQQGFDCPATANYHPPETMSCVDKIYNGLLNQTLAHSVGSKYVYSDLSMITLAFCVGRIVDSNNLLSPSVQLLAQCSPLTNAVKWLCLYEAFLRTEVFGAMQMHSTQFLPPQSAWAHVAPTWNDTEYRHRVIQGQVSDGNSYSSGGIAGHAGLFSNAYDLAIFMQALLQAPAEATATMPINRETVNLFTGMYNSSLSSRALGWNTNNYQLNTYRGCSELSPETFTHTGFTGTQVCGDPTRQLSTVLLTNRVYPGKFEQFHGIHVTRQKFNNAVRDIVDECAAVCMSNVCGCNLGQAIGPQVEPPPDSKLPLQLGLAAAGIVLLIAVVWYARGGRVMWCKRGQQPKPDQQQLAFVQL